MKDLVNFVVILLIVLMAFGTVRQSITFPNEEPDWHLAKHIFLKPYFMLYGEVYAPEIDPECSDTDPHNEYKCVPGRWIVPAVMTCYLIVANILLINLLIAVFNNTFHQVNAISMQVWKFQRYSLVIEYEGKPILPPPFILVCHIYLLVRYFIRRCRGKRLHFDNGLKLFLVKEEVEKIHDFEEEAMHDLFRMSGEKFKSSTDERIRLTNDRVENMSLRFDDINQKENSIRMSLQSVDYKMLKLEELTLQTIASVNQLQQTLSTLQLSTKVEDGPQQRHIPVKRSRPLYFQQKLHQIPVRRQIPNESSQTTAENLHKKSRNEERLRPFTDYRTYYRPPFTRSYSAGEPHFHQSQKSECLQKPYSSHQLQQLPRFASFDQGFASSSMPRKDSYPPDIYSRRRKRFGTAKTITSGLSDHGPLDEEPDHIYYETGDAESENQTESSKTGQRVSFSAETKTGSNEDKNTKPIYTKSKSENKVTHAPKLSKKTQSMCSPKPPPLLLASKQKTVDYGDGVVDFSSSISDAIGVGSIDSVSFDRGGSFSTVQPLLTPIITPTRSEYSSITDEIDTTCLNYCSPVGSPTSSRAMFFPDEDIEEADSYTSEEDTKYNAIHVPSQNGAVKTHNNNILIANKKKKGINLQKEVIKKEAEQLKHAEESENEFMELMIRKRMRQISLTESDSLSNIAKHLIEMDSNDTDTEQGYHSDDSSSKLLQNRQPGSNNSGSNNTGISLHKHNSEPSLLQCDNNYSDGLSANICDKVPTQCDEMHP